MQVLDAFENYDHVVVLSGSCTGMIRRYYPELCAEDPAVLLRAESLGARV